MGATVLAARPSFQGLLKVAWATGFTTRIGANFDTISVGLQTVRLGKP